MESLDKVLILNDWDHLRYQVKEGLKKLGHDIPLVNEKRRRKNKIKDQMEGR